MLFPQQTHGNHSGETQLYPPLEENETRSKHSSPGGEKRGEDGGGRGTTDR